MAINIHRGTQGEGHNERFKKLKIPTALNIIGCVVLFSFIFIYDLYGSVMVVVMILN